MNDIIKLLLTISEDKATLRSDLSALPGWREDGCNAVLFLRRGFRSSVCPPGNQSDKPRGIGGRAPDITHHQFHILSLAVLLMGKRLSSNTHKTRLATVWQDSTDIDQYCSNPPILISPSRRPRKSCSGEC